MNWSEERYVKLFQRDTLTWLGWNWQARCVFPLLLRKVDGAGILEMGNLPPDMAVSMMIGVPAEVCAVALESLFASGCVKPTPRGLIIPNYFKAQTTKASDRIRQIQSRERRAAAEVLEVIETAVTARHDLSRPVTPSLAEPSLAEPRSSAEQKAAQPPDLFPEALPPKAKAPKVKKEPDPRHAPLVARLVEAAKRVLGSYAFTPRDAKATSELLHKGTDDEIEARLLKAFAAGGFPSVRTIHELNAHWNHFATDKPNGGFQRPRHPGAPVEPKPFNTGEDLGF